MLYLVNKNKIYPRQFFSVFSSSPGLSILHVKKVKKEFKLIEGQREYDMRFSTSGFFHESVFPSPGPLSIQ
jgi:hypothetical protein